MNSHASRNGAYHLGPRSGTQEDGGTEWFRAGCGLEVRQQHSAQKAQEVPMEMLVLGSGMLSEKPGSNQSMANAITPEQMALSTDSSTSIIFPTTYPISCMVLENHLRFREI